MEDDHDFPLPLDTLYMFVIGLEGYAKEVLERTPPPCPLKIHAYSQTNTPQISNIGKDQPIPH